MGASNRIRFLLVLIVFTVGCTGRRSLPAIVVQTDFGVKDGAVAEMKGVARTVDENLDVVDLTHEITAFDIWEGAYRLQQVEPFWPNGTVFVSVVDPGVGTDRKSVVAKLNDGNYIVTPDNGTLTLLLRSPGIAAIREIDEKINRRPGSENSYTFHGRDVYMYTAARLAAKKISFEEVGPKLNGKPVVFAFTEPGLVNDELLGNIPVLDIQYGNVWTNIPDSFLQKAAIKNGDSLIITILRGDSVRCSLTVPFANSFGDLPPGKSLAYINSLANFALAVNQGNFAERYGIGSGPDWTIRLRKK